MTIFLHPPTLFLVFAVSTFVGTLLLVWCWWQNRTERTLLWAAAGYAAASVGILLFAGRNVIPNWLSIDIGTAIILYGFAMTWVSARVFNGHVPHRWIPLVGPLIWLVACRVPGFQSSFETRVILTSLILSSYGAMAAKEFWFRDGLRCRYPVAITLAVHAFVISLRIPLAIADFGEARSPFSSAWFGPVALEGIIFVQVIALLIVSLTKERVEMQLRSAALIDPLTGLWNRRALFEHGTSIIGNGARRHRPTSVIVFDLDRFKEINDTYGHPVGDAVIQAFAAAARASLRVSDHAGRIGGEEFAVILPDTDEAQARMIARRVTATFATFASQVEGCATACTASAGVAVSLDSLQPLADMLATADRGLYQAKRDRSERATVAL